MYLSKIKECLPYNWQWQENNGESYKLVEINRNNLPNLKIDSSFKTGKAYRIENPFLYAQYLVKKDEYVANGYHTVKELYHCTGQDNVESIANINLDFRRVRRCKFGRGVSFSPSMSYAHKQASRSCGPARAMLICDVLVGEDHLGYSDTVLPNEGYDTTCDIAGNVVVKYYDTEFYPKYALYYSTSSFFMW